MFKPDVDLRLPADGAYLALLRTSTAGLAARLDFTLDEIEDARVAAAEAATLALEWADPPTDLHTAFWLEPASLRVRVRVATTQSVPPPTDSFGWMVLTTLAEATAEIADGELIIDLTATSNLRSRPPA